MRALRRSLLPLVLVLTASACRGAGQPEPPVTSSASEPSTRPTSLGPTTLAEDVALLDDEGTRAHGFSALEQRITGAEDPATRQQLADAISPVFVKLWDSAPQTRPQLLQLCETLGHPGTAAVFGRAVGLDGSASSYDDTHRALAAIERTHAVEAVPAIAAALDRLMAQPEYDQGDRAGATRLAMIDILAALGDRRATPVLMKVLRQPVDDQPVKVHRRAVDALGQLADPAAIDALLNVIYTVPDAPTSKNIAERVKQALAAIGEPAVLRTIAMLEGKHETVNELASTAGLDMNNIVMFAAILLGDLGSNSAVEPLLHFLPTDDCKGRARGKDADLSPSDIQGLRAVVAHSLGLLGDARAVEPLCRCATASRNPGDMFPIAEALGRIGGREATACLAGVVKRGAFDKDTVGRPEFVHEIRWEAARFGLMAAGPEHLAVIEKAMDRRQPAAVKRQLAQWGEGRALLARCSEPACWRAVLDDPNADWFPRELAAINLARTSPGDADVAEAIASAYKVRNPDARVTMAWLTGQMMQGQRCSACAERLANVLEQERDSRLARQYQLSVLTARYAIAKLRVPTSPSP